MNSLLKGTMANYDFLKAIKVCGFNTNTLAKAVGKSQTAVYQSLTNPNVQLSTLEQIAQVCTNGDLREFLKIASICNETDITDKIFNIDYKVGITSIPQKTIDLVITDPPYEFIKGSMRSPRFNVGKMQRDSYMNSEMADFTKTKIVELLEKLSPLFKGSYNAYFFCSEVQLVHYLQWAQENHLRYNVLIWDRLSHTFASTLFYRSNIDYIVRIYGKGRGLNKLDDVDKFKMYSKIRVAKQGDETEHETEKPIEVIEDLIRLSSKEGNLVLDPFLGSGTTAIACMNTNRHFVGYEINEEIYKVAINRLNK